MRLTHNGRLLAKCIAQSERAQNETRVSQKKCTFYSNQEVLAKTAGVFISHRITIHIRRTQSPSHDTCAGSDSKPDRAAFWVIGHLGQGRIAAAAPYCRNQSTEQWEARGVAQTRNANS